MWLEPCNYSGSNLLEGVYRNGAFYRLMCIIIYQPNTILFSYHLVYPIDPFIRFQSFSTSNQLYTQLAGNSRCSQRIFHIVFAYSIQYKIFPVDIEGDCQPPLRVSTSLI